VTSDCSAGRPGRANDWSTLGSWAVRMAQQTGCLLASSSSIYPYALKQQVQCNWSTSTILNFAASQHDSNNWTIWRVGVPTCYLDDQSVHCW